MPQAGRPTMPSGAHDLRTYSGQIRAAGGTAAPGTVTLGESTMVIAAAGAPPRTVAYRDLEVLAITGGVVPSSFVPFVARATAAPTGPVTPARRWTRRGRRQLAALHVK